MRKYNQLGSVYTFDPADHFTTNTGAPMTQATAPKKSWLDSINSFIDRATPVVNKATDIYGRVTAVTSPMPTSPINTVQPAPTPQPKGLSTGAKVAIGVGAAAFVGGVVYLATSGDKKKGMGGVAQKKRKK